ncbi:MAG: hypothetical protein Q7T92_06155, partial [Lutibacter sp.]|nr:hypothetical protein [Lutibacter sp.]
MVKKLLKLKLLFISAWFFVGSISSAAPLNLSFNATFSLLHAKVYSNVKKNATTANFYFAENLTFVNYLWEDTPTATAGFKMVFQKVEALLLKEEGSEKVESLKVDAPTAIIGCPGGPITANNDPGFCSAVVNYTAPTTDSPLLYEVVQTAGIASGGTFLVGTTTNTFEERVILTTLPTGNSCSFDVIVTDNEAPTLTGTAYTGTTGTNSCKIDAETSAAFSSASAITGYTDNCAGIVTATLSNTVVTGTDD